MASLNLRKGTYVPTRRKRLIARFAPHSAGEWIALIEAQKALVVAQFLVWTRPLGGLVEDAQHLSPGLQEPIARYSTTWRDALRIAVSVRRAADHGLLRPKCLVRAVALSRLLEQHGIEGSRVRIGVRRLNGVFSAHAWVELGQRVLGDDAGHVSSFAQLLDIKVVDNHLMRRSLSA